MLKANNYLILLRRYKTKSKLILHLMIKFITNRLIIMDNLPKNKNYCIYCDFGFKFGAKLEQHNLSFIIIQKYLFKSHFQICNSLNSIILLQLKMLNFHPPKSENSFFIIFVPF